MFSVLISVNCGSSFDCDVHCLESSSTSRIAGLQAAARSVLSLYLLPVEQQLDC